MVGCVKQDRFLEGDSPDDLPCGMLWLRGWRVMCIQRAGLKRIAFLLASGNWQKHWTVPECALCNSQHRNPAVESSWRLYRWSSLTWNASLFEPSRRLITFLIGQRLGKNPETCLDVPYCCLVINWTCYYRGLDIHDCFPVQFEWCSGWL